ncbi:conserved hypothetical protein [Rhodopseudomonas palustris TIE-1]|uniref:hypothetical protein n=1 Tax=Rhodopseudomonas palustris TaxID=1076 RepID=UPI000164BB79|nr:hypothetical protein [Rhodopseudomonas palustris]ACE98773.1 conserved hypothetical protein [Rhodopseudomonas palustris TIE-1]
MAPGDPQEVPNDPGPVTPPPEVPPSTPGTPTEPPLEQPPGNPNPDIPPPIEEPGAPPQPNELPGYMPAEVPMQSPGRGVPNPGVA